MNAGHLQPVPNGPLPEYPEELCDPHLSNDYFTAFWHDRFLSSRLHLTASMAVQGAALNLFFLSRKQVPVGSLPTEGDMLASLLRISAGQWHDLMQEPITPLHNWRQYSYGDGRVVYGHSVVIEVARDALDRRVTRKAASEGKAVYQRQQRLVDVMQSMGCDKSVCGDKVLIERLDAWLLDNHHGQRRMPQFEASITRALQHASNVGWLGGQKRMR